MKLTTKRLVQTAFLLAICIASQYFKNLSVYITGSIVKAVFMGAVVILIILPVFGGNVAGKLPKPEALPKVLATAKVTFSVTQLITALIGSALAYIIWIPLKSNLSKEDFQ